MANPRPAAADYVLFAGLVPMATVEAKRENTNVAGKIPQAERYPAAASQLPMPTPPGKHEGQYRPWPDGQGATSRCRSSIPATAGPICKQLAELSGTWFRDVRSPANLARAAARLPHPRACSTS
jgi:type I restriction enzyme R subunit